MSIKKKRIERMNFRLGFKIIVIFLLLGLVVFSSCKKIEIKKPHDLMDVLKEGRLAVITDSSSLGFEFTGDSISGFQYEIIKAFADSLGVELQIAEQNDMAEAIQSLETGECDIIANIIPMTTEHNKLLSFSETLLTASQILVQRIGNDTVPNSMIKSQSELANDTIYLPANSPYKMRIEHLSDEIAEMIYVQEIENVSNEDLIQMVSEGKIKNTICPDQFALKYKTKYPNLDFSLSLGFNQNYSWAVHKSSTRLLEKLNTFLKDFIGTTDYWNLYRKYY